MELLLRYGASLELKAAHGYRSVHLAAIRGTRHALLLLLNRQSQVDATDDDGECDRRQAGLLCSTQAA